MTSKHEEGNVGTVIVRCPQCGDALAVPVQVSRVELHQSSVPDWSKISVMFSGMNIQHECKGDGLK